MLKLHLKCQKIEIIFKLCNRDNKIDKMFQKSDLNNKLLILWIKIKRFASKSQNQIKTLIRINK
jgi:hypothetical protein